MYQSRSNLSHPSHRDAVTLLDGQGMISRLKFDEGPLIQWPEMNVGLQERGIRVQRQASAEPAEVWRFLLPAIVIP